MEGPLLNEIASNAAMNVDFYEWAFGHLRLAFVAMLQCLGCLWYDASHWKTAWLSAIDSVVVVKVVDLAFAVASKHLSLQHQLCVSFFALHPHPCIQLTFCLFLLQLLLLCSHSTFQKL